MQLKADEYVCWKAVMNQHKEEFVWNGESDN